MINELRSIEMSSSLTKFGLMVSFVASKHKREFKELFQFNLAHNQFIKPSAPQIVNVWELKPDRDLNANYFLNVASIKTNKYLDLND